MRAVLYPEWRDSNRRINFPFTDYATMSSTDGKLIPSNVFLDAAIHMIGGFGVHYMSGISVRGESIVIIVSDSAGNFCTGEYPVYGSAADMMEMFDKYDRPAGVLVFDPRHIEDLYGFGTGDTVFTPAQSALAASAVIPMPSVGVQGFLVNGELITGDVVFVGGPGVVLSVERCFNESTGTVEAVFTDKGGRADGDYDAQIRVDIVGDPYARYRECLDGSEGSIPGYSFLKTINAGGSPACYTGKPDSNGNFVIAPAPDLAYDNPVRVMQETAGIRVEIVGLT